MQDDQVLRDLYSVTSEQIATYQDSLPLLKSE